MIAVGPTANNITFLLSMNNITMNNNNRNANTTSLVSCIYLVSSYYISPKTEIRA